jgi:uncharacterized membrane protein
LFAGGLTSILPLQQGFSMDTHSRSFAKAISWRVTGTIDTMIISLVITHSIKLAAAIGVTEVITKSLLYYVHERAWLKIPYGRRPPKRVGVGE